MIESKKLGMPVLDLKLEFPKCSKCIYSFNPSGSRIKSGLLECWRYPPKDHVIKKEVVSTYVPEVRDKHSCGEGLWYLKDGIDKLCSFQDIITIVFKLDNKEKEDW